MHPIIPHVDCGIAQACTPFSPCGLRNCAGMHPTLPMWTAQACTMASMVEAIGMALPNTASPPAVTEAGAGTPINPQKLNDCKMSVQARLHARPFGSLHAGQIACRPFGSLHAGQIACRPFGSMHARSCYLHAGPC